MPIVKSEGVTKTEKLLAELCDNTFLRLWSYPNVHKDDGKELCDLLAVYDDHVFIFFDRESRKLINSTKSMKVSWKGWKKEAVDKQVKTALGAERYILSRRGVFLDAKNEHAFPLPIPENPKIHKIVVAHGAKEACEQFSDSNVSGSLGISYGESEQTGDYPFVVNLDKDHRVHLFDSHNLGIVFNELDTTTDFLTYIEEKETAISQLGGLFYMGEEDLLAHYFQSYSTKEKAYKIVPVDDKGFDLMSVGEGIWESFKKSESYVRRKNENRSSYFWDELIQRTGNNVLNETIQGDADVLNGKSAIHEMAKEPRFSRRALVNHMFDAVENFPQDDAPFVRNLSVMASFFEGVSYVFLQVKWVPQNGEDYEADYRPVRRHMLEVACGATKNKFPHLKKVIGIGIDAPKYSDMNSEDFVLMECNDWPDDQREYYVDQNKEFGFLESDSLTKEISTNRDFPLPPNQERKPKKVGRNEPCPCRSGKKYKKCCLYLG